MAQSQNIPSWFPVKTADSKPKPGIITDDMDDAERLFHYAYLSQTTDVHFIEYELMQRVNIFSLQNKIACLNSECWSGRKATSDTVESLRTTLHDYATAIRDYAYLKDMCDLKRSYANERLRDLAVAFPKIERLPGAPFSPHHRYCTLSPDPGIPTDPLRNFLKTYLPRHLTYTGPETDRHIDEYLAKQPPETISPFVDRLARFLIGFAGGAFLIVPMLIMSLPHTSRNKGLITASLAVVAFAFIMSLALKASNPETSVATATYAAVLVVFVGTSTGG